MVLRVEGRTPIVFTGLFGWEETMARRVFSSARDSRSVLSSFSMTGPVAFVLLMRTDLIVYHGSPAFGAGEVSAPGTIWNGKSSGFEELARLTRAWPSGHIRRGRQKGRGHPARSDTRTLDSERGFL